MSFPEHTLLLLEFHMQLGCLTRLETLHYMAKALARKLADEAIMIGLVLIYSFWLSFNVLEFSLPPLCSQNRLSLFAKARPVQIEPQTVILTSRQQLHFTNLKARHGVRDVCPLWGQFALFLT